MGKDLTLIRVNLLIVFSGLGYGSDSEKSDNKGATTDESSTDEEELLGRSDARLRKFKQKMLDPKQEAHGNKKIEHYDLFISILLKDSDKRSSLSKDFKSSREELTKRSPNKETHDIRNKSSKKRSRSRSRSRENRRRSSHDRESRKRRSSRSASRHRRRRSRSSNRKSRRRRSRSRSKSRKSKNSDRSSKKKRKRYSRSSSTS